MNEQKLGAVLEIRDNASRTLEQVTRVAQRAEQQTKQLAQMIEKMDRQFQASERHANMLAANISGLAQSIDNMGNKARKSESEVSRLDRALSRLGTMGSSSIGRLGSAMGGVLSRATQLVGILGTVAGGGALMQMFKGGAALEQYQMNTRLNLQNWNGLSSSEAMIQSQSYLNNAEKYANYTPFSTTDVMGVANRALAVAQGDTGRAENLYKFAGDMAASVPGKTIEQSMEAIADAQMGEYERLKEFGVKMSAQDLKNHFGMKGNQVATTQQQLEFFEWSMKNNKSFQVINGRANALAETGSGKWSTVLGIGQSALSKAGLDVLDKMNKNGTFDKMIANSERFASWLSTISDKIAEVADRLVNEFLDGGSSAFSGLTTGFETFLDTLLSLLNGDTTLADMMGKWTESAIDVLKSKAPGFAEVGLAIGKEMAAGVIEGLTPEFLQKGWDSTFGDNMQGLLGFGKFNQDTMYGMKTEDVPDWAKDSLWGTIKKSFGIGSKKAVGMQSVPYDNMPALLHQGEKVLTREQARAYDNRQRGGNSIVINVTGNSVRDDRDIDMIVEKMALKLKQATLNYA